MPSNANEMMYCYLDGIPVSQWCGKDVDDFDDVDDGDDADADEYVLVDAAGDGAGVDIHYASDNNFF